MSDLPVTVYSPDSSLHSPLLMLREMFRDLQACRELAWRLAMRDINAQYRQSFFGILWAFVGHRYLGISERHGRIISVGSTALPYPITFSPAP